MSVAVFERPTPQGLRTCSRCGGAMFREQVEDNLLRQEIEWRCLPCGETYPAARRQTLAEQVAALFPDGFVDDRIWKKCGHLRTLENTLARKERIRCRTCYQMYWVTALEKRKLRRQHGGAGRAPVLNPRSSGHCRNGHPRAGERRSDTGARECPPCKREAQARYRARKRAEILEASE